jgi:hypothetical protein
LAANSTAPIKEKKKFSIPPALIVIGLVLVAGAAGFLYLNQQAKKPEAPPPPLTGAAREYVRNGFLQITDSDMQAHESYLKQQIVEITGNIGNKGDRVIDSVEIVCVFYDPNGTVIGRRRVAIVKHGSRLAPGETRPFRLPFDDIPETWNQSMPQMVIARIEFS